VIEHTYITAIDPKEKYVIDVGIYRFDAFIAGKVHYDKMVSL
jgi:hypothetical protein